MARPPNRGDPHFHPVDPAGPGQAGRPATAREQPLPEAAAAPTPAHRRAGLRQLLAWAGLALWQDVLGAGRPLAPADAAARAAAGPDPGPEPLTDWTLLQPGGWARGPAPPGPGPAVLTWPGDWDDTDPAQAVLARALRRQLDAAPAAALAHGRQVHLTGFLLPLPRDAGGGAAQALLVPRFGAGIYTPAPPANQVVRLRWAPDTSAAPDGGSEAELPARGVMAAVRVQGRLQARSLDSPLGRSAWLIEPAQLARYRPAD